MADVERFVDTASTVGGDGTTRKHVDADRAYASLNAWESAEQADLVTATQTHRVRCAGSAADTTGVTITGWTMNASFFATIEGDDAAPDSDGAYTESLVWSTSHYRLAVGNSPLKILEQFTKVKNVQIECNRATGAREVISVERNDVTIDGCRVYGSGAAAHNGIEGAAATNFAGGIWINNIVFDCKGVGLFPGSSGAFAASTSLYNNTVFDCATGMSFGTDDVDITYIFKNNCFYNNTTNIVTAPINATWTHDYNAIDEATNSETNGVALTTTVTDDMVDPENITITSRDVTPKAGGGLENAGLNDATSPDLDMFGTTRDDSPEIGPIELIAGAPALVVPGPLFIGGI